MATVLLIHKGENFGVIIEHPIKQWDTYEHVSELICLFLGIVLHCFGSNFSS